MDQTSAAGSVLWLVVLGVAFYMLIIRPQQKRQKEHQALMASLREGDRVVTIGGLFGTVVSLEDERVRLELAPGIVCQVARSAIARTVEE